MICAGLRIAQLLRETISEAPVSSRLGRANASMTQHGASPTIERSIASPTTNNTVNDTHAQTRALPALLRASEPLGASEQLFTALHSFTATNVARVIALDGLINTRTLQRALLRLQQRHPLLNVHIAAGTPARFVRNNARPLRFHYVVRRDDRHVHELLETVLDRPIARAPGPLFEVHYLEDKLAARSELIIVGDHSICDGVSLNALCGELLELCSDGPSPSPRPWQPVFDRLLPPFSTREHGARFASVLATFARIGLLRTLFEKRKVARGTSVLIEELSERDTRQLATIARREQTTITGVLMAAALQAVREVRALTPKLAVSVPINLRTRIADQDLNADDLGNYTSVAYLESSARQPLWPLSRALKAQLNKTALDAGLLAATPLVYRVGRRFVRAGKPTLAHVMLSNSGKLPVRESYGALRVRNIFSASSAPMLAADFSLFCNTLSGRLCINLVFSEQVATRATAARVLRRIQELLHTASTQGGAP